MTITTEISEFTAGITSAAIPSPARRVLQLSLLDWMAVGIAGRDEPVAGIVRDVALAEGGVGAASVIGTQTRLPARAAALVNGTTSHALDYDDTHFAHIGHPSVVVIPAALAMAQQVGVNGRALQEAALIGAEVSIRIGLWLGRGHYQVGYHQTATAGAFGAAMAAARVLGMDAAQCAQVLGVVATRASGLKSQFGTMGKPYNAGIAAANGVEAAILVNAGFEGRVDGIESALGFGATHHGEGDMRALDGIGAAWVFESVSHKFHACCHGLHATLETAAGIDVAADDIAMIEVQTNPRWIGVCDQAAPMNGLGAKFSYATVLAMHYLGHRTGALGCYSDAICARADVQALRARVSVVANADVAETAARLRIVVSDGSEHRGAYDLEAPMDIAARQAKVQAKAAVLLGADQAAACWTLVEGEAAPNEIGAALTRS
ncbi:MAG: MmgE/PrpD family protein [Rhodobacterales bacterium]|nr:MmgE/PrpD family protein [Rhodobacterales bacterium]